jgi:hypothetical protein
MGNLSVILNIFTIVLVGMFAYVTFLAHKDKNEPWLQTFKKVVSDKKAAPSTPPVVFLGQDWSETPCNDSLFGSGMTSVYLTDTYKQEGLEEFMNAGSTVRYGTENFIKKQKKDSFTSMTLAKK